MKKVVYNDCYGGFGISALAQKRYAELTNPGVKLYFYKSRYEDNLDEVFTKIVPEENEKDYFLVFNKDFGDSFVVKNGQNRPFKNEDFVSFDFKRSDPILIQVIEELGDKANTRYSKLEIAEVEDKYRICEYDGAEWIETPETIQWDE